MSNLGTPARWELHGPAGSIGLDVAVTLAVTAGISVEFIAPGRYRLTSPIDPLRALADQLVELKLNEAPHAVGMRIEEPPDVTSLKFELEAVRTPRTAYVHGLRDVERLVARAIDSHLDVQCVGKSRFEVTGPSRQHVAWVAAAFEVSNDRALEIMQTTAAQIAAEDGPVVPEIKVQLPTRSTDSLVERNADGAIVRVTHTERSVEG